MYALPFSIPASTLSLYSSSPILGYKLWWLQQQFRYDVHVICILYSDNPIYISLPYHTWEIKSKMVLQWVSILLVVSNNRFCPSVLWRYILIHQWPFGLLIRWEIYIIKCLCTHCLLLYLVFSSSEFSSSSSPQCLGWSAWTCFVSSEAMVQDLLCLLDLTFSNLSHSKGTPIRFSHLIIYTRTSTGELYKNIVVPRYLNTSWHSCKQISGIINTKAYAGTIFFLLVFYLVLFCWRFFVVGWNIFYLWQHMTKDWAEQTSYV